MTKRFYSLVLVICFVCASFSHARGRKPEDDDEDKFPDYNRLEMRPKKKEVQTAPPATSDQPAPPVSRPSLNTPVNLPVEDDTIPRPAPKAVPLPDNASEPPMPDDLINTLTPSATAQ